MIDLTLLKDTVEKSQTIALFGHESIDGDCIGSCLALENILKKLGKNVSIFTTLPVSSYYHFVPGVEKIQTVFDYGKYDLIFFLDFNDGSRIKRITEGQDAYFNAQKTIIVDHHEYAGQRGPLTIVETNYSSNCEVLFEILETVWPELLDKDVATYLYLGLMTDTGNFSYEKESIRTMSSALGLLKLGADKKFLLHHLRNKTPLKAVMFLKTLIERIEFSDGLLSTFYVDDETDGLEGEYIDTQASLFQTIDGADVFVLIRKSNSILKCSLRAQSHNNTNVERIAATLGGGGHKKAAGFRYYFSGKIEKDVKEIREKILKLMKNTESL